MQGIAAVRDQIDPEMNDNSYCYDAAEAVARYLNEQGVEAHFCEAGVERDPSHCYVILSDGTIVDPTLDQFYRGGRGNTTGDWKHKTWEDGLPSGNPWFGSVAVIPPGHPFTAHYISHQLDHRSDYFEDGYWIEGQEPDWWRALHAAEFAASSPGHETLADYFDRTKGDKQRSLGRLGHHAGDPPGPTAGHETPAQYFERTKGSSQRSLRRLGHHSAPSSPEL